MESRFRVCGLEFSTEGGLGLRIWKEGGSIWDHEMHGYSKGILK